MMEFLLILLLLAGVIWLLFRQSSDKTSMSQTCQAQWRKEIENQLELTDVVFSGHLLGANRKKRALAHVRADGHGKWIPYNLVAGIELTPCYESIEEGSSVTTTRRGSQIIGAGIGAALAGPAGLIVGGLSGSTSTESRSRSSEYLSSMELKLRLYSEIDPLLKFSFENKFQFDPETNEYTGGLDGLERIAARLATEIDARPDAKSRPKTNTKLETFTVQARPAANEGWWSSTFGA